MKLTRSMETKTKGGKGRGGDGDNDDGDADEDEEENGNKDERKERQGRARGMTMNDIDPCPVDQTMGKAVVQQMAIITLVMITVLPSSANSGPLAQ